MRDSGTGCRELVSKRGCAFDILCMQNQGHNTQCHTPNATWKLNIDRTKPRLHTCRGEQRSPDKPWVIRTTYVNNVCYSQQHLCFHKPCRGRRPRRPDPSTAFVPLQCWNYANSEHGRPKVAPTYIRDSLSCRKIASLGALFYFMLAIYFGLLCSFLIPHSSLNPFLT